MSDLEITGRCLCGAVTYEATSKNGRLGVCHCSDCQRWKGGPFIGLDVETISIEGPVRWYSSSEWAERGSCSECGSALFWRMKDGRHQTVSAGSVDDPSAIKDIKSHIFIDSKPDYYDFTGDAPRLTGEETLAMVMEQMKAEDA
ncbi:GFA family protein [Parvularcula lutaonensis]|uniref:GFA family protein n=1 Tax=Parvularcula lutaonensis TaxID=491923 RepID=A0ABV7M8N4_9PROT|nr:GFA family protein [Parvularcula lutaonensis]GGY56448.1 aldehyde-activating protein [Parvularcula lutaonensis]